MTSRSRDALSELPNGDRSERSKNSSGRESRSQSAELLKLVDSIPPEVSIDIQDEWNKEGSESPSGGGSSSPSSNFDVSLGLSTASTRTNVSTDSMARLRMRPDVTRLYRTPGAIRCNRRMARPAPRINYFMKYDIPSELLVALFSYLNKSDLVSVSLTCKLFRKVSYDPRLWEYIDLGDKYMKERTLHSLADRGMRVMRLTKSTIVRDMCPQGDSVLLYPDASTSKLTHIDLSMAVYSDPSIIAGLLQRCKSLQGVAFENSVVDERICVALGHNPELAYLKMVMCEGIDTEGLYAILDGCRKLVEVNFAWSHFTKDHVKLVCEMLPSTLRRLNLSGVIEKNHLTDEGVMKLVRGCPLLTELDLSDAPSITEASVRAALVKLSHLRDLALSRCYGIDPMAFMLAKGIRSLSVFGCVTEEGVAILRTHLRPTLVNENPFSTVAHPTCGVHRTSIWGLRSRDHY